MTSKTKINSNKIHQIQFNNGYGVHIPWTQSTGMKMNACKYSNRSQEKLTLASDFLLNSFMRRGDSETNSSIAAYLSDAGVSMISYMGKEETGEYQKIALESGSPLHLKLGEAIEKRRSTRFFSGDYIEKENLFSIVRAASGISCEAETTLQSGDKISMNFRTVSSAGGLYPVDLYVVAKNIQGFPQGVYRYQPLEDCFLKTHGANALDEILKTFCVPEEQLGVKNSACLLFFAIRPFKAMKKYGARGMRFCLHEVGGISQNIHLSCVSLGLGSVDCASFYEEEINRIFTFDGVYETIVHSVIIGTTS